MTNEMENRLPGEFDLIVVGTGMIESILSAAASRIGKRVLHIDSNNYYGGQWASFNLDAIQNLENNDKNVDRKNHEETLNAGEEILNMGNEMFNIEDFNFQWHIIHKKTVDSAENPSENDICNLQEKCESHEKNETEVETKTNDQVNNSSSEDLWSQSNIMKLSRKFNIDLTPRLQFARGDLVELLISSNIARYTEYRSVSRVLTWLNGQLEVVPCSRSDVFANSRVSVMEKRILMKLLTSLDNESQELKNYEDKTFRTYLKDQKLTPNLIHYVLYAISTSTDKTLCCQGVENTKRFLNSLGRFGKTPFLLSMYGSGEIPQSFCRLSAVFGGVYALGQPLNGLIFSDDKFTSLLVGNQRIKADHLVMSIERSPKKFVKSTMKKYISRAVFITDRSIMASEKEHLTLLLYPPECYKNPVTIIEMGSLTGTCPRDLYLVHLISKQLTRPEEDFEHVLKNLFRSPNCTESCTDKPKILWSCYFSLPDTSASDLRMNVPSNVYLCPGPDMDLDCDFSIARAKEIFKELYSDMEFLPRAPDPEEIVIEGEDEGTSDSITFTDKENEGKEGNTEELVQNIESQTNANISSDQKV